MKESPIKVMLIEDDKQMCDILTEYLKGYSIEVTSFRLPRDALYDLGKKSYSVILLDLSLPQMDGLDVCKLIREKCNTPIIITSARGSVSDKVLGLETGADDYLPKPFDPRELVARIRTAERRNKDKLSAQAVKETPFRIDAALMEIYKDETPLRLTPAEFEVLKLLLESPNVVLSRDKIVDNVESMKWESIGKSVDVIVGRIRQKIGDDPKQPRYIKAIKGFGYKFTP